MSGNYVKNVREIKKIIVNSAYFFPTTIPLIEKNDNSVPQVCASTVVAWGSVARLCARVMPVAHQRNKSVYRRARHVCSKLKFSRAAWSLIST